MALWPKISSGKSGAREVAGALLMLWAFLVGWMHFWIPKEDVSYYKESFSTITTAIFTFSFGAFGVAAVMNRLPGGSAPPGRDRQMSPTPGAHRRDDPD